LEQANPRPITDKRPPESPRAFLSDLLNRFSATGAAFLCSYLGLAFEASSMGGFGLGQRSSLFFVTIAPLTT
jgi:hypothetical protein